MDESSKTQRETLGKMVEYKEKYEKAQEKIQKMESEVSDLKATLLKTEKDLKDTRHQLDTAHIELEERTLGEQSQAWTPSLDVSVPTATPLQLTTRSEFGGKASTASLKKQIEELQRDVKEKQKLLDSPYRKSGVEDKLKSDISQLKKELKKYEKPKKLIEEKEAEIQKKNKEIAVQMKQINGLTERIDGLSVNLSEREEELVQVQQENQLFQNGAAEALNNAQTIAEANNKLQDELKMHQAETVKLTEALHNDEEEHSKRIADMERQLQWARDALHTVNQDAEKYQDILKGRDAKHKKHLKEMENQLQQMKKMISALTNFMALQNEDTAKDGTAATVIATQMKPLIYMAEPAEQECGLNAIYNVINEKSREKIKQIEGLVPRVKKLSESEYEYVKAAAQRTMMKIESDKVYPQYGRGLNISCDYFQKCHRFIKELNITDSAWDPLYNMCYCSTCNAKRGFRLYFTRGEPPKDYGIPVGWCRFALKVSDAKVDTHNIWDKWHVAFHGTTKEAISQVIEVGHLVVPGDTVLGGKRIGVRPFHIPERESTRNIFLSPTIRYAGMDTYASPSIFTDGTSGKMYQAKVAFQVRINPTSYQMRGETVGATSQMDPAYLNEELEWVTNQHGSTELYGILVKLSSK